jgi:SAM-dependent methyltransferase
VSALSTEAIWHDVECGSYAADLGLWEELATQADGPVLELGSGTGRVALHLARRGFETFGLDRDPELIAALAERAAALAVTPVLADAREFVAAPVPSPPHPAAPVTRIPAGSIALAIAPTQMLQLLPDAEARAACLRNVAAALHPGGRFAAAILEGMPPADDSPPPLPDVREVDGWVYSSLAVEAAIGPSEIVVHRLRHTVSPDGELTEEPNQVRIATFPAAQLEEEAAAVGLRPHSRQEIPATDIHVGSLAVVLEKEG